MQLLRHGLDRVERERNRLQRENARLHKRNERQQDQNACLKREPAAAYRAGTRPAVVTRKLCGGNRCWRGAAALQTLTSAIRTARQHNLNPHTVPVSLMRAMPPGVAPNLSGPPPLDYTR